jgi:alkylation response protein AidB-like acyl-CoA dehydrogenase
MKAMILGAILLTCTRQSLGCPTFQALGVRWESIATTEELSQFIAGINDQIAETARNYDRKKCWRDDHESAVWHAAWRDYSELMNLLGEINLLGLALDKEHPHQREDKDRVDRRRAAGKSGF